MDAFNEEIVVSRDLLRGIVEAVCTAPLRPRVYRALSSSVVKDALDEPPAKRFEVAMAERIVLDDATGRRPKARADERRSDAAYEGKKYARIQFLSRLCVRT